MKINISSQQSMFENSVESNVDSVIRFSLLIYLLTSKRVFCVFSSSRYPSTQRGVPAHIGKLSDYALRPQTETFILYRFYVPTNCAYIKYFKIKQHLRYLQIRTIPIAPRITNETDLNNYHFKGA